jgi:hypothetical protein
VSVFHWCCSPAIRFNIFIGLRQAQTDIKTFPLLSGLFSKVSFSKPANPFSILHFPFYKTPLVLGKTIFSASRFTAILIAFAKALKIASIL